MVYQHNNNTEDRRYITVTNKWLRDTQVNPVARGISRSPGRGVLTRMLSMNGVWSCMQLVGRNSRRLGSANYIGPTVLVIDFSSADASELHLFFDKSQV